MTNDARSRQDGGVDFDFGRELDDLKEIGATLVEKLKKRKEAELLGNKNKSTYKSVSADVAREQSELSGLRRTIEDKLNDRSEQGLLKTKISHLLTVAKKPQKKEEYLVAFKRGFLKLYDNLTPAQVSELDKFIAEHVAKEDSRYFPSGQFDIFEAKGHCEIALGLPMAAGILELYLDTPVIPPQFQGVETLKDLITKYSELYKNYSAETAGKAKAEKELADAKAKQEKEIKTLEADKTKLTTDNKDLTDKYTKSEGAKKTLEGELVNWKAKFTQAEDKAVALEKEEKESRKGYVAADARVKDLCDDLQNLISVFDNSKMNSDGKLAIYGTYIQLKCPKDSYVAGAVHNNMGQILGNKRKDYEAAKVHFEEAVKYAEKECAANPRSDKAKERREKYERNLKNCEHNMQMLVLTAGAPAEKQAE